MPERIYQSKSLYWVSQYGELTFEKMLLLECQSNNIENCLVLFYFRYVQLDSVIFPALIRHSFPVAMGDCLQQAPFKNPQKRVKTASKISLVILPGNNDTLMHLCILSSWENEIPLNKLFILGGRLFHSPNRKAHAKVCSSQVIAVR